MTSLVILETSLRTVVAGRAVSLDSVGQNEDTFHTGLLAVDLVRSSSSSSIVVYDQRNV